MSDLIVLALMPRLLETASTLYKHTPKIRLTPAGRPIVAMRASVPRTSGTELSGWVTASARDWKDTPGMATTRPDGRSRVDQLPRQAVMAGWPTPKSTDTNGPGNSANRQGGMALHTTAQIAGWPTPTATDAARGVKPPRPQDTGIPLVAGLPRGVGYIGDPSAQSAEARVMRIKGYGNAIVPQAAAEFIGAFMEVGNGT